jgi:hypothetical protein
MVSMKRTDMEEDTDAMVMERNGVRDLGKGIAITVSTE